MKKVLIANRGEIAVRIIRACREMGIATVAVYSEADRAALHVRQADEAFLIGPPPSAQSYLNMAKIIEVCHQSGADSVHPGYGFLSENAAFSKLCRDSGLTFIGPGPEAIASMGSKTAARQAMMNSGVRVVPGSQDAIHQFDEAIEMARTIGYPVLIKAAGGGGGKGMRLIEAEENLKSGFEAAQREALSAFGNKDVYLEKYIVQPRHIEIQILADQYGNTIHLGERECSIQRRHQKLIEESPSPIVTPEMRHQMGEMAVAAAKAANYVSAGTVEFIVDVDRNFYFLEMNTRLQVEHPVTELVTGLDLVKAQLRIAQGEKLWLRQEDFKQTGHALECRIVAEDPYNKFLPVTGRIEVLQEPAGPGVRVDSGVYFGYEIPIYYDPMIAKLITWAPTRDEAIDRMKRALQEYRILGIKTVIPFSLAVMNDPDFLAGNFDTSYVSRSTFAEQKAPSHLEEAAIVMAALHQYQKSQQHAVSPNRLAETTEAGFSRWRQVFR